MTGDRWNRRCRSRWNCDEEALYFQERVKKGQ